MLNVTFPIESMDWNKLVKHRNILVELQSNFLYKSDIAESIDTAISVIERLMMFHEYNTMKYDEEDISED